MAVFAFDRVPSGGGFLPVAPGTNPFVVLQFDDLLPVVSSVSVWRDDGGVWSRVRGAIGVRVVGAWSGTDHECGFNRPTTYRVEQFDSGGNSLGYLPSETVTLTSAKTWLHNPLAPLRGVAVGMTADAFGQLDRPHDSDLLYPRGRSYGVSVGRGRRGLQGVNLNIFTDTLDAADKVQALLGDEQQPLPPHLVVRKGLAEGSARVPHTLQVYVPSIVEVPFDVRYGGETVRHEISGTEAAPPTPKLAAAVLTRGDLSAHYATRGARSADNLTRVQASRRWELAGSARG